MKILVEQHQGIGDVVHTVPLLQNLRDFYKDAEIDVIVQIPVCKSIVDASKYCNKVYYWPKSPSEHLQFVRQLQKVKYDIVYVSVITNKWLAMLYFQCAGIDNIVIETDCKYGNKHFIKVPVKLNEHRVTRNLNLLHYSGVPVKVETPHIAVNKTRITKMDKEFIGICVGTNTLGYRKGLKRKFNSAKQIPIKTLVQIMKLLSHHYKVVLFGGLKEKQFERCIDKSLQKNSVINLIGEPDFNTTMKYISSCRVMIGGDTGIMHLADAMGTQTLMLFGPTDPKLCRPLSAGGEILTLGLECQYCYNTEKMFECEDYKCINGIHTDLITDKLKNMGVLI